ncbi:putative gtp-binding protein [Neofusicoccum parvum UCRNP2]|uniref:Putative gtp-binding protein n=1 Tax=Botryosphaeria parva (strain UCR-NP2) TaxID=1287680 RepID=R1G7P4_BOTPV|nr:putative gtp-binding protein [Neofusicoccum parvum UCRNP2]
MHRALQPLRSLALLRAEARRLEPAVPLFLCPALLDRPQAPVRRLRRPLSTSDRRQNTVEATRSSAAEPLHHAPTPLPPQLPLSCPGCGAPAQTVDPGRAGYYAGSRKAVKAFLAPQPDAWARDKEDAIFDEAVHKLDKSVREQLGLQQDGATVEEEPAAQSLPSRPPPPVCDRCHNLLNHASGTPIQHPSIDSIEQTIGESPYKQNHIYHVLDAADFPMSLVPNLTNALKLSPLRTQNRRSKHREYTHGRVADVSFIITRSDLLAPKKEQVDHLMPYLVDVLRDALGRTARNVRLGNVRCVSSKRGWWTKEVKENIWERGGAGWMVGKVNVGKSNLFEVVFPKGRNTSLKVDKIRNAASNEPLQTQTAGEDDAIPGQTVREEDDEVPLVNENSLLPPPQKEMEYPVMPVISSLPGTTASPIRVPFGNGRGELIDLPGLARTSLDHYVRPEHKLDLVMKSRIVPERISVKPGQSLLLGGGLIRITPTTPGLLYLMHPFVPLTSHVTSTQKALAMEAGERTSGIASIVEDGVGKMMKSAGLFSLRWDVTKQQAGPLTRKDAVALSPEKLPFVVWSMDLLIDGVGWVEIVAQARKNQRILRNDGDINDGDVLDEIPYPEIDVFTPEGKFVGARRPMNAWLLNKPKQKGSDTRSRPRRSMVSVKNQRSRGTAT